MVIASRLVDVDIWEAVRLMTIVLEVSPVATRLVSMLVSIETEEPREDSEGREVATNTPVRAVVSERLNGVVLVGT